MSPQRIEELVTRPIEEKIREIPEVKHIRSDSKTGISLVKVDLKDNVTDLDAVWQILRYKMAYFVRDLPDGTSSPRVNDQVGLTARASVAICAVGF